jgi:hypothetical protein
MRKRTYKGKFNLETPWFGIEFNSFSITIFPSLVFGIAIVSYSQGTFDFLIPLFSISIEWW